MCICIHKHIKLEIEFIEKCRKMLNMQSILLINKRNKMY